MAASASHGEPIDRVSWRSSQAATTQLMIDERQSKHRKRGAAESEKRRGDPGLHAQHVVLAVKEKWEGPELAQVLRHQADNRLIRIEIELLVCDHRIRADQHEQYRYRRADAQRRRVTGSQLFPRPLAVRSRPRRSCSPAI